MEAMKQPGDRRKDLMLKVPPGAFYRCRGLYLQHANGDHTESRAKALRVTSENEVSAWSDCRSMIKQDAFGELVRAYQDLCKRFNIFS